VTLVPVGKLNLAAKPMVGRITLVEA